MDSQRMDAWLDLLDGLEGIAEVTAARDPLISELV